MRCYSDSPVDPAKYVQASRVVHLHPFAFAVDTAHSIGCTRFHIVQ